MNNAIPVPAIDQLDMAGQPPRFYYGNDGPNPCVRGRPVRIIAINPRDDTRLVAVDDGANNGMFARYWVAAWYLSAIEVTL